MSTTSAEPAHRDTRSRRPRCRATYVSNRFRLRRPAASEAVVEIAYGRASGGSDLHYWTHGAAGESILRGRPCCSDTKVAGTVLRQADDGHRTGRQVPGFTVHPGDAGAGNVPRYPAGAPKSLSPAAPTSAVQHSSPTPTGPFTRLCRIARTDVAGSARRPARCALAAVAEPAAVAWACRSPRRRTSQEPAPLVVGQRTNRCPRRVSAATRRR